MTDIRELAIAPAFTLQVNGMNIKARTLISRCGVMYDRIPVKKLGVIMNLDDVDL